jgi:hypothetical protein
MLGSSGSHSSFPSPPSLSVCSWMSGGYVKIPMLADGTLGELSGCMRAPSITAGPFLVLPLLCCRCPGYCNMYEEGGFIPTSLISYPDSGGNPTPKPSPSPPPPTAGCGDSFSACASWAALGFCSTV